MKHKVPLGMPDALLDPPFLKLSLRRPQVKEGMNHVGILMFIKPWPLQMRQ